MKFVEIKQVNNDQIMLIQNEYTGVYQVIVESAQNYSFTPDYVSKGYKTKQSALKLFNSLVAKYQSKI